MTPAVAAVSLCCGNYCLKRVVFYACAISIDNHQVQYVRMYPRPCLKMVYTSHGYMYKYICMALYIPTKDEICNHIEFRVKFSLASKSRE